MTDSVEIIKPSEFQSPDQLPPENKKRLNGFHIFLAIAVFLAVLVIYFILNARAVQFVVNADNPDIQISGGISLPIGESLLLLSGDYEVDIDAEGYEDFDASLDVNSDTPPQVFYEMSPLPGDLRVALQGAAEDAQDIVGIGRLSGANIAEDILVESLSTLYFTDIPAGTYQLTVDANLYSPQSIEVEIPGRELTKDVAVTLKPNWGWIEATTDPAPVELYANGSPVAAELSDEEIANGIYRARVEAGFYKIRIGTEDYKPVVREISLEPEQVYDFGKLTLEHVDSRVSLVTEPAGVTVLINENYAGETPLVLDLLPELNHRIELLKAGYQSKSDSIRVAKNGEADLSYRLEPDLIQVSVSVYPENAELRINGAPVALTQTQLSLSATKHQIEVSSPGYEAKALEFLPIRGTRQHLQVRLLTNEQALWANIPPNYKTIVNQEMKLFREPGEVVMGSNRREIGRRANETTWTAELKRPFYVSLTEVTNLQYKAFEPEHTSGHFQSNSLDGANQPVIDVSWQQAALYCNWLSEKEGLEPFYATTRGYVSGTNSDATGYRLLTEAEWTWLAKSTSAGFSKKYIWGEEDTISGPVENYADQSVANWINFTLESVNDGFEVSAPVGSFPANGKGLYDMSGNVNEWIHDWYEPAPYKATETIVDPTGPEEGEFHVIRGASWARGYLPQLRLAYRDYDSTGRNDLGFRIARYAM